MPEASVTPACWCRPRTRRARPAIAELIADPHRRRIRAAARASASSTRTDDRQLLGLFDEVLPRTATTQDAMNAVLAIPLRSMAGFGSALWMQVPPA
jgi:hypothetical protein